MDLFKYFMLVLGVLFVYFGIEVYFKKNYSRINGYADDVKNHKYDERYAKRLGLIEFVGGLVYLASGGLGFLLPDLFSLIAFIAVIVLILIFMVINAVVSNLKRNNNNNLPKE